MAKKKTKQEERNRRLLVHVTPNERDKMIRAAANASMGIEEWARKQIISALP